jgi:CBS domain-containing protein
MSHHDWTVADYMTSNVMSVTEEQPLEHLLTTLNALQFRHLPVTADGKLLGLLSERDLLRISASTLLPHSKAQDHSLGRRFLVRDVMNQNVATVSPTVPLLDAAGRLFRDRLGCLPVVNDANDLLGILTTSDCLRAALTVLRE